MLEIVRTEQSRAESPASSERDGREESLAWRRRSSLESSVRAIEATKRSSREENVPVTSPTAKTPLTLVSSHSSATMSPLAVVLIPSSSRPRFLVDDALPIAQSTWSASIVVVCADAPFLAPFASEAPSVTVRGELASFRATETTCENGWILIPVVSK